VQSYPLKVGKPASRNLGKLITVATSVLRNALAIAGFRALIGELSPVITFPTFFSLADSSARTLRLLRMMLLFGPGTGSVRRKERFKMDSSTDDASKLSHATRRAFCTDLLLTSTALVLSAPTVTKVVAAQDSTVAYPTRKIEGAETLQSGSCLYFNYPTRNDPAVLLRSNEGEYTAYSRRCSHAGCSVEFDAPRRCLKCPCHYGAFDARMGHVMVGPPRRPLDEIVLQMRAGGQIWAVGKSFGSNAEMIAQGPRRR
jgi:Rieske Fe-S protein